MDNIEIIKENGEKLKVEVILAFNVPETNKDYIAYTIDDDPDSVIGMVLINEFDSQTNQIKKIPESEKDAVLKAYEEVKNAVIND